MPHAPADSIDYRSRSLWLDQLDDDPLVPRAGLAGDTDVDVAIVGAGFTGLWTALQLRRRDPRLRVLVLEAEVAGFGASGRNGGWCSALLPMSPERYGTEAERIRQVMRDTVDAVGRDAAVEGIDCHFTKGGTLTLARRRPHVARLQADVGVDRSQWLVGDEARALVGADGVLGGAFTPHCAALQPARLVRGLARAVERAGIAIVEQTTVHAIEPGRVRAAAGTVRAAVVVRATEAFTARLPGQRRTLAPLYSLMVATEPLPASFWAEVGWSSRCTLHDGRHSITYAQRTADDRIALGGRGAPYHWGSRIEARYDRHPGIRARLAAVLAEWFPALDGVTITHHWGGPLAAPRDWTCSVGLDRSTGLAWAGGYVGDGVATAHLAGRILADLITGTDSDVTSLPWVGHRGRRWEPEPLRWLGINGGLRLAASADAHEARTDRPARGREWLLGRLLS